MHYKQQTTSPSAHLTPPNKKTLAARYKPQLYLLLIFYSMRKIFTNRTETNLIPGTK
jgi:hypothetical protein